MKKNTKKLLLICQLFVLLLAFDIFTTSCSTINSNTTPYVIGGECVLSDSTKSYEYVGFDYFFYNSTDKTVSDFTVVFYVYDEEGNSPFASSNCISTKCEKIVPPHTETEGEISLDSYISSVPDEPYKADYIYVSEINYTDGSNWRDMFGFYAK